MKTHIAMVIQSSCHLYSKIHYIAFLGDANTVEDLKIPIKQDSTDILIPWICHESVGGSVHMVLKESVIEALYWSFDLSPNASF